MTHIVLNFLLKRVLKPVQKNVYGCILGSDSIEMNKSLCMKIIAN